MHETDKAKALLLQCEIRKSGTNKRETGKQNHTAPTGHKNTSHENSHHVTKKPKVEEEEEDTTPKYTDEDVRLCKEIMGKKDYYDILGVKKESTDDEIKKAYRKLALKLHPDKNRAPHSTEAFKKVSTSFACLSDKQKRTIYDEHGTEDNFRQNYGQYFREEEFNPEDIFEAFFGGLFMNGNNVYRQRGGRVYTHVNGNRGQARQRAHPNDETNRGAAAAPRGASVLILQFMPFILLIVLSMLANFTLNGPATKIYSFNRSSSYPYPEKTKVLNLQFFVGEDYLDLKKSDPYKILQLEKEIEVGEYSRQQSFCSDMKTQQRIFYQKARNSYTQGQEEYWRQKAEGVDLGSCTRADEYYRKLSVVKN